MAFTTLAERFEQRSREIYGKFSSSDGQLVTILPDSRASRADIKNDTRSVPVISTQRDINRISRFLSTSEGQRFTDKQLLLQTGNIFADTKIYNPKSPILNAVPFVHVRRNIPTSLLVARVPGLLQNNTVTDVSSKFQIAGVVSNYLSGRNPLIPTVKSIASTYLRTQLKGLVGPLTSQKYADSRPELKVFTDVTGPVVFDPQPLEMRGVPKLNTIANVKALVTNKTRQVITRGVSRLLNRILPRSLRGQVTPTTEFEQEKIPTFVAAATEFRQNFYDRNRSTVSRMKSAYLTERIDFADNNTNPTALVEGQRPGYGKTQLSDPYNKAIFQVAISNTPESQRPQTTLSPVIVTDGAKKSDIINFRIGIGNTSIPFRALISSIKESIKTEFNEQRYVGRTERFVTYGGAKRSVNLTFNIVAFSQNEIDTAWSRVNLLTGMAYPEDVSNGFMVPPLVKLSIGGIYDNQPCYIESLDYDFLDESITFDIDKEVPFAINVNMQVSLLEKRTKFYNSPFYKITENLETTQRRIANETRAECITRTYFEGTSSDVCSDRPLIRR